VAANGRPAGQKASELARDQLLQSGVQTLASGKSTAQHGAVARAIVLLLISSIASVSAHTRRSHGPNPVEVVLQPFLLARSAVSAVAEPIVLNAPRALATVATAPVRMASRHSEVLHGEVMAYMTPRPKKPAPPDPEETEEGGEYLGEDADADLDSELEPEPERFGQGPTVAGSGAILRNGIAYAPRCAPQSVKTAIWAANSLHRKPYLWGGGHGSFFDRGYDCSGTVSFALRGAGAIGVPLGSSELMRYGKRGRGRWFTIYARPGHTFALIAGLRLDTTDFRNGGNIGPRWHAEMRDTRGYVARHPAGM
jgi:cell wall-associated NlpC family hydrolase